MFPKRFVVSIFRPLGSVTSSIKVSYLAKLSFPSVQISVGLSFLEFMEDICPLCGSSNIPVLDFWWYLPSR